MRITNLMILLAIIAGVILVAQYISQLKKSKNGNNFVSGGRVFLNWVLAIVLVVCIGGLAINAFSGGHQEAKPDQTKTEDVKYTAPKAELPAVSVNFNKKVKLNDDGLVKVKFKISPQTKVTVRGHKSKQVVETFKASKGSKSVTRSYTFDFPGTYDIIAERDGKRVVKQLKVKDNTSATSSSSQVSSSSATSSSRASSSSEASTASSSNNNATSSNGNTTASSSNGGTTSRRSQRSNNYPAPHYYSGNSGAGSTNSGITSSSTSPASSGENGINDGPGAPEY